MKDETIVKEVLLNVSTSKVWKAITNTEDMKLWYFDISEFKPTVGFEFQFEGGKDDKSYLHLCKITEVIPGKKLSYSWRYDGYPGNSLVTFELFEEGNRTKLKLTHEGIESFGTENPDLARENFVEGWNQIIGTSIKEYLESK
ncbi:MAG: ATPase [Ignavibacteria bacterium GWA2_35_9]|nr:MAG: ATPase [Ignavibacteria bacterium GWA2_35_9]OGU51583.1 MAG: ATPase [Ignavibacteria bacterium GWC2_36_12]